MASWNCSSCGDDNGPNNLTCTSCGRAQLSESVLAAVHVFAKNAGSDSGSWICGACETVNSGSLVICSACGGVKASAGDLATRYAGLAATTVSASEAGADVRVGEESAGVSPVGITPPARAPGPKATRVLVAALVAVTIVAVALGFLLIRVGSSTKTSSAASPTSTAAATATTQESTISSTTTTAPAGAPTLPVNASATPPQQVTAFQVQVTITYAYGAVVSSACTGIHTVAATSVFDDEHCTMTGDTANFAPGTYLGDPVAIIWFIHGADTKWYSDFPGENGAVATSFTQTFVGDPGKPFLEHVVAQYAS